MRTYDNLWQAKSVVEGWRTVQVREEILKKVEREAKDEKRNPTNMVEILLSEALANRALGEKITA